MSHPNSSSDSGSDDDHARLLLEVVPPPFTLPRPRGSDDYREREAERERQQTFARRIVDPLRGIFQNRLTYDEDEGMHEHPPDALENAEEEEIIHTAPHGLRKRIFSLEDNVQLTIDYERERVSLRGPGVEFHARILFSNVE